jgi:hypothetical protein
MRAECDERSAFSFAQEFIDFFSKIGYFPYEMIDSRVIVR